MAAPACSNEEFVELWRTHGSAAKIARVLGVAERNIHARRRRLESKFDFSMASRYQLGGQLYKYTPEDLPRKHVEIENGVALIFSDAHFWPGVRTTAYRALLLFIRELKPQLVVCNGDAFDGASISRYPRIGWDSKPSVIDELKACQARLGEIEEAAAGAKLYWPLGNHDARFENRLAQNAPQYEGVQGFSLKDHFPAWAPCWSVWINDDVVVKHRFKSGIHATHNNTVTAGKTIVTGHLHSLKVTPLDDYNGTRWGVDTGTLAEPYGPQFVDYSEDNPKNHRSGYAILTFHDGRLLWPEVAHVTAENQVDFRGMVISV